MDIKNLWLISHLLYWSRFFFFFLAISFSTSLLAMAIAFEATELHKGPLGSGRLSRGLKYWRIDIVEQLKHLLSIKCKMASEHADNRIYVYYQYTIV